MWAAVLEGLNWLLSAIAGLFRRILRAFWMSKPPLFFKDFQDQLPMVRLAPPPGPPAPPVFDPAEAKGTFIGTLMRVLVPGDLIRPLLPSGVILPIEASRPGYQHPVNLAFGFQRNVHPDGLDTLPGSDYLEFVLGIPNLYLAQPHDGFQGPCSVLARLALNQILPIILGRILGLPKILARIHTTEDSFRVLSFLGKAIFVDGSFQPSGRTGPPGTFPEMADIIRTFAQPCVSRSVFGSIAFTKFIWYWDLGMAQDTSADVTIRQGWGDGHYVHQGSANQNCDGAWRVRVPWVMQAFEKPQSATAAGS